MEAKAVRQEKDRLNKRLRGTPRDELEVRISKTLSWVLRHGAKKEGLFMRPDGYVRVKDLLALPKLQTVDFPTLERIVQRDAKARYNLLLEESEKSSLENVWWIRANQGHSIKEVDLEFQEIVDAGQIPMAVHGTNQKAWETIQKEGLSPMNRTYIHLAQHWGHIKGCNIPGLRNRSNVLIYIDVDRAIRSGIKFYLSANGVVLTKGDETGYLRPEFFMRVTDMYDLALTGWDGGRMLNGEVSTFKRKIEPAALGPRPRSPKQQESVSEEGSTLENQDQDRVTQEESYEPPRIRHSPIPPTSPIDPPLQFSIAS
ncbi:trna phosphotransferase 1 [Pyrrhoderma noxium]|uniref:2'-phosphotransferase n=1 Tax=Pyrrhoderma noxium TaxID=2282107 RepID=A0A286UJ62_9AGAM|nr:trna phosphotransferase 1 [Pyrrhoderma noxium]